MTRAQDKNSDYFHSLLNIQDIGESVAADLAIPFFAEDHNLKAISDLLLYVRVEEASPRRITDSPVAGKTVVFTGTLPTSAVPKPRQKRKVSGQKLREASRQRLTM